MDELTKEALEESIDALFCIRSYFDHEVKCTCNDEDGVCERCDFINELTIARQRMKNIIE